VRFHKIRCHSMLVTPINSKVLDRYWRPIPERWNCVLQCRWNLYNYKLLGDKNHTHIYTNIHNTEGRHENLPDTWVRLTKIITAKHLTPKRTCIAIRLHYNYLTMIFRQLSVPSSQNCCMATGAILIVLRAGERGKEEAVPGPHEMNGPASRPHLSS
jgi:hypothetical protein